MLGLFSKAFRHYGGAVEPPTLGVLDRWILAWVAFFRILFDGAFASRVALVKEHPPELAPAKEEVRPPADKPVQKADPPRERAATGPDLSSVRARARSDGALALLAALQREGRLVDFLEGDVTSFQDDDVGAAARVVHAGCKRALAEILVVVPIRAEEEGGAVKLEEGFSSAENKLTGNVKGKAPFSGVLRHKGWRAKDVRLPTPTKGDDPTILAPAEIEL